MKSATTPLKWMVFTILLGLIAQPAAGVVFQNQNKVRENISTLMLLKMTTALDLSEEQTAKIFPRVNETEKEKAALNREMAQSIRKLRILVDEKNPGDDDINRTLDKIKTLREQIRLKDEELSAFLDGHLTVLQRGKYLFFQQEFFRDLRNQLNRARVLQNKKQPLRKK